LPVGAALLIPGQAQLWSALHGVTTDRVILAEDATGLSVLANERSDFRGATTVFVNGLGQSYVPFGGGHTTLGLIPALLHPAPLDVAVIGLGSGDTLYASAARAETQRIDSIEINGAQLPTLRELHARTGYGGLGRLLGDDRIRQITGDGRRHLLDATRRYDVIEADALRPTSAFAGSLYSVEYFQLLRKRLKPGGLAVTWVPTARTLETFRAVFPHVARFDFVLVGSNEPISIDRNEILRRARSPAVQEHFLAADLNLAPWVAGMLRDYQPVPPNPSADPSDLNSDLFPRDELGLP
jgi:spermidine synthase